MKTLINNKEEFLNWLQYNYKYEPIPYDENEPKNYPCIVVEKVENNFYNDNDWLHYCFVYLEDFK